MENLGESEESEQNGKSVKFQNFWKKVDKQHKLLSTPTTGRRGWCSITPTSSTVYLYDWSVKEVHIVGGFSHKPQTLFVYLPFFNMVVHTMRHCCFTLNNPKDKTFQWPEFVRYAIWQLERGESGTPHLQGYIEFSKTMSFTAIKKVVGKAAHVEARRGTRDQARDYCRKEESRVEGPWEFGTWISGSGHRTDIETVLDALKEGKNEEQILDEHPIEWARNYKVIERYRMIKAPKRTFKSAFHVHVGDSGTGKTRAVQELAPAGYWKRPGQWYDGYDGVQDLILDEIDKQEIPLGDLLRIIDRYPMLLPVKGGHVGCCPSAVYATSNVPVEEWYPNIRKAEREALIRRIDSKTTYRWVQDGDVRTVTTNKEIYMPLMEPVAPSKVAEATTPSETGVGTPPEVESLEVEPFVVPTIGSSAGGSLPQVASVLTSTPSTPSANASQTSTGSTTRTSTRKTKRRKINA